MAHVHIADAGPPGDGAGRGGGAMRGRGGRGRGGGSGSSTRLPPGDAGKAISAGEPVRGRVIQRADRRSAYPWVQYPVLLQREGITHAPGQQYDMERDLERGNGDSQEGDLAAAAAAMSSAAASFATGRNLLARPSASAPRVYYSLYLFVSMEHLMPNCTNLIHYRVDTKANMLRATAHTFFLQAMSHVGFALTAEQRKSNNSMKQGYFMVNGKPHRRARAFIDTIIAHETPQEWERQSALLARDVPPGANAERASNVDAFAMHELNKPSKVAGYLYRIEIFDPSLHPGALFAYQLIQNGMYRGHYSLATAEIRIKRLIKNTVKRGKSAKTVVASANSAAAAVAALAATIPADAPSAMEGVEGGSQPAAAAAATGDEEHSEADPDDESENDRINAAAECEEGDPDSDEEAEANEVARNLEARASAPIAAAIQAASAVAGVDPNAAAPTPAAAAVLAQGDIPSDSDDNSYAPGQGDAEMADAPAAATNDFERANQENMRRAPRLLTSASGAPKAVAVDGDGSGDEDPSSSSEEELDENGNPKKKQEEEDDGPLSRTAAFFREKRGQAVVEIDPALFYREVTSWAAFSQLVAYTVLCDGGNPTAAQHADGFFDEASNLALKEDAYDAVSIASKLHYSKIFSFENALGCMERSLPGRIGIPSQGMSAQFAYENYRGPIENPSLRVPYPQLSREINPLDLNPEILSNYKTPSGRSAVDALLEDIEAGEITHRQVLTRKPRIALPLYSRAAPPSGSDGDLTDENSRGAQRTRDAILSMTIPRHAAATTASDISAEHLSCAEVQRAVSGGTSIMTDDGDAVTAMGTVTRKRQIAPSSEMPPPQHAPKRGSTYLQRSNSTRLAWLRRGLQLSQGDSDHDAIKDALLAADAVAGDETRLSQVLNEILEPRNAGFASQRFAGVAAACRRLHDSAPGSIHYHSQPEGTNLISGGPRVRNSAYDMLAEKMGDQIEKAHQELSSSKIEGPFARIADLRNKKKNRVISAANKLPFRTDTNALRRWLDENCPQWLDKLRQDRPSLTASAQDYGISKSELEVLLAMDFDREERYRDQYLTDALTIFRQESAAEVLATLTLDNDRLSAAHKGLLVHAEKRPNKDKYFSAAFATDPSLSLFSTAYSRDALAAAAALNRDQHLEKHMDVLYTVRLSSYRQNQTDMPSNRLLIGPAGSGKSDMMRSITLATPEGVVQPSQHQSMLANHVSQSYDNIVQLQDEAARWIVESGDKLSADGRKDKDVQKAATTQQAISYQRNEADENGKRVKKNVEASYIHNIVACANRVSLKQLDSVDRFRLNDMIRVLTERQTSTMMVLNGRSDSVSSGRMCSLWQAERWDECVPIALMMLLEACHGLPPMNLDLLLAMMPPGENELVRWMPMTHHSPRCTMRVFQDTRIYVFVRINHTLLRSEASPYLRLTDDPDEHGKMRLSAVNTKPFSPRDLVTLCPAAMYAQYGECIPSMFNYLNEVLPLRYYLVVLAVASELMGFTFDYFEAAYHRHGIPLPDILERANQRRDPSKPKITRRRDASSLLEEFYDFVDQLREGALATQARYIDRNGGEVPHPKFASRFSKLSGSVANGQAGDKTANMLNDRDNKAALERLLYPSRLYYSTAGDLYKEITAVCQKYFTGIDEKTVETAMSFMRGIRVRAPLFSEVHAKELRAATMKVEGFTYGSVPPPNPASDVLPQINQPTARVVYEESHSFVTIEKTFGNRAGITIMTHGLMVAWHELYYMYLTAHENKNTRSTRVVLPHPYTKYPRLMHGWEVRPNPFNSPDGDRPKDAAECHRQAEVISRILMPVVLDGDSNASDLLCTMRESNSAIRFNSSAKNVAGNDSADSERLAFQRHLRTMHYSPPSKVLRSADGREERPYIPNSIDNVSERYVELASKLIEAPGATENYIQFLQERCVDLAPIVQERRSYPEDHVVDADRYQAEQHARVYYAKHSATLRLTSDQWDDLISWCRNTAAKAPQEDARKVIEGLLSKMRAWKAHEINREELLLDRTTREEVYVAHLIREYQKKRDILIPEEIATMRNENLKDNLLERVARTAFYQNKFDRLYDYLLSTLRAADPPASAPPAAAAASAAEPRSAPATQASASASDNDDAQPQARPRATLFEGFLARQGITANADSASGSEFDYHPPARAAVAPPSSLARQKQPRARD